jgi:hypothetical protein
MNHHGKLDSWRHSPNAPPERKQGKIPPPFAVTKWVVVDVNDINASACGINNGIDDRGRDLGIPARLYRDSRDVVVFGSTRDEASHGVPYCREGFRH